MHTAFHPQEIRDELSRVLASKGFVKSPLLSGFLKFVVENTLEGKSHQIKEYTVGTRVLNKPHNFNPQLDASVRIHAIRLRKLLAEYYQQADGEYPFRIELPKGGYHPVFKHVDKDASDIVPNENEVPENSGRGESICIVPFQGYLHQPALDFSFSGFCEFLSQKLSEFQDITVVSFYSASRFMEEGGKPENIGKALGVSCYITGSIEVDKDLLKVSFQLFDAQSNVLIWSKEIAASMLSAEVTEVADRITDQIAASLAGYSGYIHQRKILQKNQPPPIGNKMANAIFWYYHYHVNQTPALFYEAIQKLEKVLQDDENCALCWAVLSNLYANALIYKYETAKNPVETAHAYVNKALQLDPNCQHAYFVKAWLGVLTGNKDEAIIYLEKIEALNPKSSTFKAMYSLGMSFLGEFEKSITALEMARQLNPIPFWWMNLPEIFLALKKGAYDKVLFHARKSGTPPEIFEHVMEMVGLYYLDDRAGIDHLLKIYIQKYPDGLPFIEKALPAIIFDEEVAGKVRTALQALNKMALEIKSV